MPEADSNRDGQRLPGYKNRENALSFKSEI
jgi:hypothetical protein